MSIQGKLLEFTEQDFPADMCQFIKHAAIHRLRDTGLYLIARPDTGRPRRVRNPKMVEEVLQHFQNNAANVLPPSHSTV